jgi:hypothetical protein
MATLPLRAEEDPHLIVRRFVEAADEMPAAIALAARRGLELEYDPTALTAALSLSGPGAEAGAPDELYRLTGGFDRYRLLPPIWKFVHPITGEDVGISSYPGPTGSSIFHTNGVICAHWSRLAYAEHGGPHSDWGGPSAWQRPQPGYTVALTIPDMLDRIIREVGWSRGRMAELPH